MLSEGVASINATAIFKDAPHPNTALLFARWMASVDGQKVWPKAAGLRRTRKSNRWTKPGRKRSTPISVADLKEFPKYEKIWKQIFQLR